MYKEGGGSKSVFLGQTQVMLCVKTMDQFGKIAWFSKNQKISLLVFPARNRVTMTILSVISDTPLIKICDPIKFE